MRIKTLSAFAAAALALATGGLVAQIDGGARGLAAVDSSGAYEVAGIGVDVAAKTAEAARLGGWRLAQRRAWTQLSQRLGGGGAPVSDGTLDQIVSGIVVEREHIGPTRYIAKLGVLFDRGRASALLGISTYASRSPAMLVIPVQMSGGVAQVFEQRTEWQAAWARFRTGNSTLDYVRPSGSGADALLLNAGQATRPGRGWWRTIIDQYGASDILVPTVRLYRQWPGGPVIGVFTARHGPDGRTIGSFTLRVGTAAGLPQLLDAGVARIDALYQRGLRAGLLDPDPTLSPPPAPEAAKPTDDATTGDVDAILADLASNAAGQGIPVTVQFDTPAASTVSATESAMRGVPGVRSAQTTSLALGGVSIMRVVFDGDPAQFRAALEARGFQVFGSGQTVRIRRAAQLLPPDLPADSTTTP
ncbi:heavy-metal-associated domain-containing protein [Sphingomonas sp.]|uniref:heavy-metal-associated domain-containing protein n=1 Tax=Sphingomonas sp. TaxID=28214 RepID=UPI0035BC6A72